MKEKSKFLTKENSCLPDWKEAAECIHWKGGLWNLAASPGFSCQLSYFLPLGLRVSSTMLSVCFFVSKTGVIICLGLQELNKYVSYTLLPLTPLAVMLEFIPNLKSQEWWVLVCIVQKYVWTNKRWECWSLNLS